MNLRFATYLSGMVLSTLIALTPVRAHSYPVEEIVALVPDSGSPGLRTVNGGVELLIPDTDSHQFYIYSITGQMVKSIITNENITVDLPQGCYIVKCREWSKKIIVR